MVHHHHQASQVTRSSQMQHHHKQSPRLTATPHQTTPLQSPLPQTLLQTRPLLPLQTTLTLLITSPPTTSCPMTEPQSLHHQMRVWMTTSQTHKQHPHPIPVPRKRHPFLFRPPQTLPFPPPTLRPRWTTHPHLKPPQQFLLQIRPHLMRQTLSHLSQFL